MKHIHFDSIDSTQRYARSQYHILRPQQWIVYTADTQTEGIGQHNRTWVSPSNVNLYATYSFLINNKEINNLICIPQVACLQVVRLLKSYGIEATIKWTNDVLAGQKKICGILVETIPSAFSDHNSDYTAVLIGVGMNINSDEQMLKEINQPTTSIMLQIKRPIAIEQIFQSLSNLLAISMDALFCKGFSMFKNEINDKLEKFLNQKIAFETSDGNKIAGHIKGIAEKGQLIWVDENLDEYVFTNGKIISKLK